MRCTSCGRSLSPGAVRCLYCGGAAEREEAGEPRDEPIACPVCEVTMEKRAAGPVTLDLCGSCQGLWFDRGELEQYVAARREREVGDPSEEGLGSEPEPEAPQDPGPVKYLSCPRCSETMQRRNMGGGSGVIVDLCSLHGIFLDKGELDRIVTHLDIGEERLGEQLPARKGVIYSEDQKLPVYLDEEYLDGRCEAERRWHAVSEILEILFWNPLYPFWRP